MPDGGEKNNRAWGFDKKFIVNCLCNMAMPDHARFLYGSRIFDDYSNLTDPRSNLFQRGSSAGSSIREPQRELEGECPMEVKKIIGHGVLISYS